MIWLTLIPQTKENYACLFPYSAYSIVNVIFAAAFWPCLPYVVQENMLGVAYGIVITVFNFLVAAGTVIEGIIHDNTLEFGKGYDFVSL